MDKNPTHPAGLTMQESDFIVDQKVSITVGNITRNYLIARFHNHENVMREIARGLNEFQGVRRIYNNQKQD